ncbi:MAG: Arm DNA-binding domain-containing protein [Roseiarcus sp.]
MAATMTRGQSMGAKKDAQRFQLDSTKRAVDNAAPRSERYIVWDVELKGFGLRVEPSSAKTVLVRYRPNGAGRSGAKRFMKVGRYESVTPDEARNKARAILGAVAGGDDPAGEQSKSRRGKP